LQLLCAIVCRFLVNNCCLIVECNLVEILVYLGGLWDEVYLWLIFTLLSTCVCSFVWVNASTGTVLSRRSTNLTYMLCFQLVVDEVARCLQTQCEIDMRSTDTQLMPFLLVHTTFSRHSVRLQCFSQILSRWPDRAQLLNSLNQQHDMV